jgi:hypothetical protein
MRLRQPDGGTRVKPNPPEPPRQPGCTCPYQWKGLGRLYGISMGEGWVRMRDDPACPVHKPFTC